MKDLFWRFVSWYTGEPINQLKCSHPQYARDYKLDLLPEENAFDAYEVCMNCAKEWRAKRPK